MELRIFELGEVGIIRQSEVLRKFRSQALSRQISALVNSASAPDASLKVTRPAVNITGQIWGEKWVEYVGSHLYLYARGGSRDLLLPAGSPAVGAWRQRKSMSGDVSGAIGEALFARVMERTYAVPTSAFAHLRAVKMMACPDFEFTSAPQGVIDFFDRTLKFAPAAPFPCEVKAVTKNDPRHLATRIFRALEQLNAYWTERDDAAGAPQNAHGIVTVLVRNVGRRSYDGFFVGVT